jgi:ubiquinone/menaquinone biosynthesis C-methylase UbiE
MNRHLYRSFGVAALVGFLVASLTAQTAQPVQNQFTIDAARLTKAMSLTIGQTVADIGAGGGELTIELARIVGPSGRVFATDINAERAAGVGKIAAAAGMKNVTALPGHETKTNLPDRCCDALVIRFVYHHFADPAAMNASVFQSLKPGGRVAVIDFAPDGGKEADTPAKRGGGDTHGVTIPTVIKELRAAGFELVSQEPADGKVAFMVVMRRPS